MSFCKNCGRALRAIGFACLCGASLMTHGDLPHDHEKESPLRNFRVTFASASTSSVSSTISGSAVVGGRLVWIDMRKPSG